MKTATNAKELPALIYRAIFHNEQFLWKGQFTSKTQTSKQKLRKVQIGDWLYLEQNKFKDSENGRLAKKGHKIIWIIHQPTNTWVGKIINGKTEWLPEAMKVKEKLQGKG